MCGWLDFDGPSDVIERTIDVAALPAALHPPVAIGGACSLLSTLVAFGERMLPLAIAPRLVPSA